MDIASPVLAKEKFGSDQDQGIHILHDFSPENAQFFPIEGYPHVWRAKQNEHDFIVRFGQSTDIENQHYNAVLKRAIGLPALPTDVRAMQPTAEVLEISPSLAGCNAALIMPYVEGWNSETKRSVLPDDARQSFDNRITWLTLIGECIMANDDPHDSNIRIDTDSNVYVIDYEDGLYSRMKEKKHVSDPVMMLKTFLARENARTIINHFNLGDSFIHYQKSTLGRDDLLQSLDHHKNIFAQNKNHLLHDSHVGENYCVMIEERMERLSHYLSTTPDGPGMI
jgi:hypothetical protein